MKTKVLPKALSSWNSAHLDVVRSLATLAVVAEHTYRLFFASDAHPSTALSAVAECCSRVAGESVMVFFVLSGFFICAIVKRSLAAWTWKRYLIDRFSRLYVVLLPALIFTALVDAMTAHTSGAAVFLHHTLAQAPGTPSADHHSAGVFWGNLAFLQLIRVPAFGSDMPLWSLSSEFWYYIMFPCACLALLSPGMRRKVPAGLLFVAFVLFFPHRIVKYMLIWLLGALVYWLPSIRLSGRLRGSMLGLTYFGMAIVLFAPKLGDISKWHLDLAFSIVLAVWLFALVRMEGTETRVTGSYRKLGAGLAGCSYSIYVTHFPILLLIRSWKAEMPWVLTGETAFRGLGLVAFAAGVGWVFSRLTEAHTQAFRKLLIKIVDDDFRTRIWVFADRTLTVLRRTQAAPAGSD